MKEDITSQIIADTMELQLNKNEQKEARKDLSCADIPFDQFMIGGDVRVGNKMFLDATALALDSFDTYCDTLINQMTLGNLESVIIKIKNKYEKINKHLQIFDIELLYDYIELKIQQCRIQERLLLNKKRKKEIEQTEREIIKEQLKEEKQIQKTKEKLEKERIALQYKFNKEFEQTGIKNGNIQRDIENLESEIEKNEYALKHNRAGYVYVVSNDDMKEGQYKIGITRRSVEERMNELGTGASHSFPMNIHGYVYCEDCFEVESALHKHFANQRVNQVNPRKEWFKTTLQDIQQAFKDLFDIDIILTDINNENYLYSKDKVSI